MAEARLSVNRFTYTLERPTEQKETYGNLEFVRFWKRSLRKSSKSVQHALPYAIFDKATRASTYSCGSAQ